MHKTVKFFKSRIQLFLECNDVQGLFLLDEPLFAEQRDSGVRLFADSLERGFRRLLIDMPFFLTHLLVVDTREVGGEEVVPGIEEGVAGIQRGEGLISREAVVADSCVEDIAVFL